MDEAAIDPSIHGERPGRVAIVRTGHGRVTWTPRETAHALLRRLGVDVVRYPGRGSAFGRRMKLLDFHRIDVIIDVGANVGQYGRQLRDLGFKGRIVSFEPLPVAYAELSRRAGRDAAWQAFELAIGDHDGQAIMHVAANSVSSSLLGMLPAHLDAAPYSEFVGDIEVEMTTLSEVIDRHVDTKDRLFVKVDAQGYESRNPRRRRRGPGPHPRASTRALDRASL